MIDHIMLSYPTLLMDNSITRFQPDFQTFIRDWMIQLELYLQQLLHVLRFMDQQDESRLQQLIHRVTAHYHEYFLAKARVYRRNVFLVLSPPWFSLYERTFMWLAGFKPGLAIHIAKSCGIEFRPDQTERLERLAAETSDEETVIAERLAQLEQQVVAPPMLALARMGGKQTNGMVNAADIVVDRLAAEMEVLVECADYLREKTVAKVIKILTTAQTVRFLVAIMQFQLRIRHWGQMRDAAVGGDANLP